ncbi:MAG: peptidylprolyl isomerase [Clostridia bacterium]|nr:peptidylprolyl isomerase [Clostridia bacterium]
MIRFGKKYIFILRVSVLLLAAAAVLGLAGCSSSIKPIEGTKEDMAVVGQIAGRDVYYDEVRYLTLNFKAELEATYGEGIWNDPATAEEHREELEKLVWEQITSDYYAVAAMADKYYLGGSAAMFSEAKIEEAVQKDVDKQAEECGGGKKNYLKSLAEANITDRLVRFYLTAEHCATELSYILCRDLSVIKDSDEAISDFMHSDKFVRTNHIFLEGKTEANKKLISDLREQIISSEKPEMELILLKGRYCNDYTMTTIHGKYFARYTSDCGDEYEDAAFALKEGGVSGIVESRKGYYVIMRLPVEDQYLTENFDFFKDDIIGSQFNVMLAEEREKLTLELNEYGKSIDLVGIRPAEEN